MPPAPASTEWRATARTPVLVGAFGVTAVIAYGLTAINAATAGGLGLVTPWLLLFSTLWVVQVAHLLAVRPASEAVATAHLLVAVVTLTADALTQPVGFYQWMIVAVLDAVAALGAVCLQRRRGVVAVWAAACTGIALSVASTQDDPLQRVTAIVTVIAATLVPALVSLALVTRLERFALREQRAAVTDPLTLLANRAGLRAEAPGLVAAAAGRGDLVAVTLLDVDHFKQFNDRHGHAAGDAVLVAVAGALRDAVRQGDLVVRRGGEEVLVVAAVGSADDVTRSAERMRLAVSGLHLEGLPPVTVSVGTAVCSPDDLRAAAAESATAEGAAAALRLVDRLTSSADAAMYEAKRSGRDRVRHACPDGVAPLV